MLVAWCAVSLLDRREAGRLLRQGDRRSLAGIGAGAVETLTARFGSMRPAAHEVFVPGGIPTHTLVRRRTGTLEAELARAAEGRHRLVLVRGISKVGKSVLARSAAIDPVIAACGAHEDEEALWRSLATNSSAFSSETFEFQSTTESQGKAGITATVAGLGAAGEVSSRYGAQGKVQKTRGRDLRNEVLTTLRGREQTLVLEDAHRLSPEALTRVLRALREPLMQGLRVIATATTLSGTQMVIAQPDLLGRMLALDVPPWALEELTDIAVGGFDVLGLHVPAEDVSQIVRYSFGSPFLTQLLCLEYCHTIGYRQRSDVRMSVGSQDVPALCRRVADQHAIDLYSVLTAVLGDAVRARLLVTVLSEYVRDGGDYGSVGISMAPLDLGEEAHESHGHNLVPYGLEADTLRQSVQVSDPMVIFGLRWRSSDYGN